MELAAGVRHEEVVEAVARVVARGDAHPGVRVVDPLRLPSLDETEPERTAGAGDVQVEPVRVEVVGDVEVDAAVAVDVGERRAETVVEATRLEPRRPTDLAEDRIPAVVADVEVEQVALGRVVSREARLASRESGR